MDSDVGSLVSNGNIKSPESGNIKSPESGNRQHPHVFCNQVLKTLILFTMASLACLVLYHTMAIEENELERVLKKAAMPNKTVIITTLNEAWAEPNSIFDLFLESFRIGNQTLWLLKHLVVAALDQKAYDRCLKLHTNCYFLKTQGIDFSGEAHFMTPDYLKMMWRRIDFLRIVLDMRYNFIFTVRTLTYLFIIVYAMQVFYC
ncbi:Nucleotide-diphospho-sugar transferase family protein [Abeliophyllum distichum]|uniref:Nucleotide-diphospho-sugar transferase family protein n=1 Tax=Abeliophyllum distichum TaxID=126358 RepID=A0ABD1TXD8_9LAMI